MSAEERGWKPRAGDERIDCPTCELRDVSAHHPERCRIRTTALKEAKGQGSAQKIPEVTTADLWAHLGHVAAPQDATRIVRQVIDLGWRPVVGSDSKRLWKRDES